MPHQVHGSRIVELEDPMQAVTDADAVITRLTDQWIGVRTADCVPVLLVDTTQHIVAAVHAGWRGTVAHITRLTVQRMVEMGGSIANIYAAIGPSIGPDAFEVGEDVALAFANAGRGDCVAHNMWGPLGRVPLLKPHVDLWQSNVMDLVDAGVELDHIDCTPCCTYSNNDVLFSARREGIGTGRIISAIKILC